MGQEVRTDVGNKNIAPTSVDEVVRVSSKFQIPPFGCKAIHGRTGLLLMGYKLNVMTHGLKKKSPQLPLGVKVLSSYATLTTGSNRITVVLRNNTNEWVEVQKKGGRVEEGSAHCQNGHCQHDSPSRYELKSS